jgi:hypothetical protein
MPHMEVAADMPVAALAPPQVAGLADRRIEPRQAVSCDLWMIDHHGSTVLRCRCIDSSPTGMRLRVPLGYGVAEGQRYELRSHLPDTPCPVTLGLVGSRWATVVRAQLCLGENEDHLDVGVVLDVADSATQWVS